MSGISQTHKIKTEHFKNMVAVAFSDGYFDEVESDFLAHKAREFGLTEAIVDKIIEEASELPFIVPENLIDRENQLADIVYIAIIDGEIRTQEYKLCLHIASKLGFEKKYVDEVINLTIKLWRHSQWYKRSVFRAAKHN